MRLIHLVVIWLAQAWEEHWPFSRGKGLAHRFHDFLFRLGLLKPFWTRIDGIFYLVDTRDHISKFLVKQGAYEPYVVSKILENLPVSGVFVEVGAHIGSVTLKAARKVGSNGRVIAIEANPYTAQTLRANIEKNAIANITVMQEACSDNTGIIRLFLSSFMNIGKSSMSSANAGSSNYVEVQTEPLDQIIRRAGITRCDLVKIDVEGAELKVLQGMRDTLERYRPVLILEIIPDLISNCGSLPRDIPNFLSAYGYESQSIGANDYLFVPDAIRES